MGIISKDMIEEWILPHLTVGDRGFEPTVPIIEIVDGAARAVHILSFKDWLRMARTSNKRVF
jgi:hypothetical protein